MKRKKRVGTKKGSTKNSIIVKVSLVIIVFFVLFATVFKITELILTHKNDDFPKMEISLKNAPIEEIDINSKDTKYSENIVNFTMDDSSTLYENVEIKGRGNTTWEQPKKPYQLKFADSTNLLNHGKARKYILLADYLDPTHLRNSFAFFLSEKLNENYAPKGEFTEVFFDKNYHGLYFLTEKIEIGATRINLKEDSGILVEVDNVYGILDGCHRDKSNDCIIVKDINNADKESVAIESFTTNLDSMLKSVDEKNYSEIISYLDIDSFAKYFLLSEFTANPDAYNTSFYLYQDGKDDKIHVGPGWDFDLALGNKNWAPKWADQQFYSPFETMFLKRYINRPTKGTKTSLSILLYDLMDIPEFEAKVKEIYQETLSGKGEELLDYIQSQAKYIRDAALRDQERWRLKTNFDEEVDYLVDWIAKRYDHFEQTYGHDLSPID